ncbi:MAG: VCBS repeat-containing protein [Bacteroidales bacterium]
MKNIILFCFFLLFLSSCDNFYNGTFQKVSPEKSGIHFTNTLIENDTLNYTKFPYMYMGGGVSVGDINNDGLDDIFFSGNLVKNKLYLNKGDMKFEDISEKAGIEGKNQWFTGSTMVDINNDGWLDIYICVSAKYQPSGNLLFINNKNNTFTESAASYGIDDKSSSVQATFFDYNNDGLLDLYVANYPIVLVSMGADFYRKKMDENIPAESGHLYRNNGNNTFTNVTKEAGVQNFGMSIGVVAMDFNNDGWKDLYISNDFNPPDYFYLNNGDGTFREIVKESAFQTSIFGMGFDAADINNDGLLDMYQIDMTPEDHYRALINVIPMRRETFYRSLKFGFHYQYMQSSLQLNNGIFDGIPIYSNISLFTGTAHTDWSWGGVFFDMDNDGFTDLFVANGVLKDINNQDILSSSNEYFAKKEVYRPELFPSTPVKNYAFKNNGDLTFSNYTAAWGFDDPTLTNGMAYGDFDNDGDLDFVINNVNEVAFLYENKAVNKDFHYLKIRLNGPETNRFGLGSIVNIKTKTNNQMQELTLTRGYQSSMAPVFHFGLGKNDSIKELKITWPDGRKQVIENIKADQTLTLDYKNAKLIKEENTVTNSDFKDITVESGIMFKHTEDEFDDFTFEPLLPHKNSQMGPGLAVGDVNNDGLDDFFVGNAAHSAGALYLQANDGKFKEMPGPWIQDSLYEDTGALLFDADNDGKQDLYVVSGGNENDRKTKYNDRLYLNTKNGFIKTENSLPEKVNWSGKCIKAADYDKDGDLDLFLGGRIFPGNYPAPANSYILRNNGKKGKELKFEDVTDQIAPVLKGVGLVTDAIWTDFDGDNDLDLIVVGEWMKINFLENTSKGFINVSDKLGFNETVGWWNCIKSADVDHDGDNDYLLGNLGLNYKYKTSKKEPFSIYSNDFNVDGRQDIVLSFVENGINYPVRGLDASTMQIPFLSQRFKSHDQFAKATLDEIYGEQMLEASLHYTANTFASCWLENKGSSKFVMHKLPNWAQLSSINDVAGINYKNKPAFIVAGNLYGSEVETPRNDASIGLILEYDKDELKAIPPPESKFIVKGEVKVIARIKLVSGKDAYLFAINNGTIKLIENNSEK